MPELYGWMASKEVPFGFRDQQRESRPLYEQMETDVEVVVAEEDDAIRRQISMIFGEKSLSRAKSVALSGDGPRYAVLLDGYTLAVCMAQDGDDEEPEEVLVGASSAGVRSYTQWQIVRRPRDLAKCLCSEEWVDPDEGNDGPERIRGSETESGEDPGDRDETAGRGGDGEDIGRAGV